MQFLFGNEVIVVISLISFVSFLDFISSKYSLSFSDNSTFSKNEDAGVKDSHRTIDININGNGKISIDKGTSKEEVVQILLDNAKDIFVRIVEQEALVGGDASYEY